MADVKERILLSWDLVFKLSTLVILVFSGLSLEQVDRVSKQVARKTDQVSKAVVEVQQQAQALENRVEKTHDLVTENRDLLHGHTSLTAEHQTMFTHLQPLFQDIVQRQGMIRADITQLAQLADNLHEHEEALAQLLTERTQRLDEIAAQLQALTTALQQQQKGPQP